MRYLSTVSSLLRKLILLGWAMAVIWIYLGNLVNFHQHRIWGKQLIPVACYSTRAKEKEGLSTIKSDTESRLLFSGHNFDFSTPGQQISGLHYFSFIYIDFSFADIPLVNEEFENLSFRGPPAA